MWGIQKGFRRVLELHVVQPLLRGAVILSLICWEFYLGNLLSEVLNHVPHIHNEVSTPESSSDDSNGTDYLVVTSKCERQ